MELVTLQNNYVLLIGGKSAIMAAIIVGLGGKATATSRNTSLQQFIRTGSKWVKSNYKMYYIHWMGKMQVLKVSNTQDMYNVLHTQWHMVIAIGQWWSRYQWPYDKYQPRKLNCYSTFLCLCKVGVSKMIEDSFLFCVVLSLSENGHQSLHMKFYKDIQSRN